MGITGIRILLLIKRERHNKKQKEAFKIEKNKLYSLKRLLLLQKI
jgi:hypothetical protein